MCEPYAEARPEVGARVEKEIGEKVRKIIRYQLVSTYFLHGAFYRVLILRVPNQNRHIIFDAHASNLAGIRYLDIYSKNCWQPWNLWLRVS